MIMGETDEGGIIEKGIIEIMTEGAEGTRGLVTGPARPVGIIALLARTLATDVERKSQEMQVGRLDMVAMVVEGVEEEVVGTEERGTGNASVETCAFPGGMFVIGVGRRNQLQGIDLRGQVEGIMKGGEMVVDTRNRMTGIPMGILIIIGVIGLVIGADRQGDMIGMVAMIGEIDIKGSVFDMSHRNK